MRTVKAILLLLLLAFLVYAVLTSPDRAYDIVEAFWDVVVEAFRSLGGLVTSLLD